MPSASLQSRIRAFEALSSSPSSTTPTTTPTANSRVSLSNLLESPISPSASTFHPIPPFVGPAFSSRSHSPPPSIACQASLIDLKDWIVEDGPVERSSPFSHALAVSTGNLNGIREPSRTPSPSRKSTLIQSASSLPTPLINLESPQRPRPPLPPRNPSLSTTNYVSTSHLASTGGEIVTTLRPPGRSDSLTIEHTYPPGPHKFGTSRVGHTSESSVSSFHSVSLSSDGNNVEIHSPKISPKPPSFTFEVDSSVVDLDTASIAESFENVSAPSVASPLTAIHFDWEQAIGKSEISPKLAPPSLPNRPFTKMPPKTLSCSVSGSSSFTASTTKTRRPPPPPPPYQSRSRPSSSRASVISTSASTSDRSSILSNATTASRTSVSTRNSKQHGSSAKPSPLLRPTPVPSMARSRYELLFDNAVRGRRKAEKKAHKTKLLGLPPLVIKKDRQAAGWRGVPVDLATDSKHHLVSSSEEAADDGDSEDEPSPVISGEKLNGRIVEYIWSASSLDRTTLRNIWNECDPQSTGSIDRDAFVRGMWRIDEELRRAQLARRTLALTAASSQRIPHRPLPPVQPHTTRLPV